MSSVPILCKVQARFPFKSNDPSSLSFEQGATIEVLTKLDSGWWDGWCNGARGWFPSNYVEVVESYEDEGSVGTRDMLDNGLLFSQEDKQDELDPYRSVSQNDLTSTLLTRNGGGSNDYRLSLAGSDPGYLDTQLRVRKASLGSAVAGHHQHTLSSDWSIQTTEDGSDCYYYNRVTGEMRSTPPDEDSDSEYGEGLGFINNGSIDGDEGNDLPEFKSDDIRPWDEGNPLSRLDVADKLPSPWLRRLTPEGRTYYCNPVTQETTWDLNQIDPVTGHLMKPVTASSPTQPTPTNGADPQKTSADPWLSAPGQEAFSQRSAPPRPLPRSPSRQTSVRKTSVIDRAEPLTWSKLSAYIALSIHNLNAAAKSSQKSLYVPNAAAVVNAIRFMLFTSGTHDKDSVHMRTNSVLRVHHRTMMAAMSKLILSSQLSAQNSGENVTRMLSDSNELLIAVREFVSTCQDIGVMVEHIDPKILNDDAANKPSEQPRTLQNELVRNLVMYGANMQTTVQAMLDGIRHNDNDRRQSRSSLATVLLDQFRKMANQISQFLNLVTDLGLSQAGSFAVVGQLNTDKKNLLEGVGLLLCRLQTLSNDVTEVDKVIMEMEAGAKQVDLAIGSICSLARQLLPEPLTPVELTHNLPTPPSTSGDLTKEDNDDDPVSPFTEGFSVDGDSRTYESTVATEHTGLTGDKLAPAFTKHLSQRRPSARTVSSTTPSSNEEPLPSPVTDSQIPDTPESPSKQTSRKLKKILGDDVPSPVNAVATPKPTVNDNVWFLQYDYDPSEIVFNADNQVKGGTLYALVERLTLHDYLDMSFINTFLLTYRSFCTSMELLDLLKARYNLIPPDNLTAEEFEMWTEKKLKLVRLRVYNVLKNWLEVYYNEDDHVILDPLSEFIEAHVKNTLNFSVDQLERLIRMRKEDQSQGGLKRMIPAATTPPEPILPRNRKKIRLLDIDTLEMARQLTIMDFKLYSSILPVECLDKAWSRDAGEDGANIAVHIRASIEYCNQVTSWVSDSILSQTDIKKRSNVIKYWVYVAEKCRILNNFNTCMAVLSAFDNSSVGRLKRTWETVGARTNQILAQIRKLMGANRNFTEYRAIIHSINPPCIPFLGIYLQDLTFIEDGNPNFLKNSKVLINFAKRAKTAEVIREIQQYQSSFYHLESVEDLQNFIQANLQSTRDEEQLYNESLKLEPREREDEKITRLLQESGFL